MSIYLLLRDVRPVVIVFARHGDPWFLAALPLSSPISGVYHYMLPVIISTLTFLVPHSVCINYEVLGPVHRVVCSLSEESRQAGPSSEGPI